MSPLILVLIVYAVAITVLALIVIGRAEAEQRRQKQEPVMAAPATPAPAASAPATPAPARPAYNPDALLPPIRHTAASRTRSVPAPQPQQGRMTAGEAFIIGALIASSWDSCSHSSGGDYCDDSSNWC
jgi:hypothetical protein